MNKYFKLDYYRMTGKKWNMSSWIDFFLRYDIRYLYHLRRKKSKWRMLKALNMSKKYGLEILSDEIGEGLYIGHAHNINVHPEAKIGKNCNLNKGCTIGRENRGKRNGAPCIGNEVWVGSNASIVGKVNIGNDVLIAPNSYVNFDVPDHSIVIGNPAVIKHSLDATKDYIQNKVDQLNDKYNVLFIINSFSWGGAEKLVYDMSLELIKYVNGVTVVALYDEKDKTTERYMIQTLQNSNITTYVLGKPAKKGRFKAIRDIIGIIKKEDIDIVHAHCGVPMLLGKVSCKCTNVPIVCTVHNTQGYSQKIEKFTSWMVDTYVSIGEAAEQYMIKNLGIKKNHICRIYNSVDIHKFISGKKSNQFWEEYGGKPNDFVVLNVARVHKQKNQLCLLKSINKCIQAGEMNIKLYILGHYEINDPVYIELQGYIKEHNLTEYIKFLGMHKNVEDFLANSDCFVMTSYYEGLSVAFLEAIMAGVPVITTDLPFVREINNISACSVVVPQDDSDKLAEVIIEKNYDKPSEESVAKFKQMFSLENFVSKHCLLYEKVLFDKRN